MIVSLKDVLDGPHVYEGEEPASILALEPSDVLSTGAEVQDPIRYRLRAYLAADQLIVEGTVKTEVRFHCVRCAEVFPREVGDPAFQCLYPVSDKSESVDLTPDIRETILLNFPPYPVCQEACKGLCGRCGANLNRKACSCRPLSDFRWNELEKIEMPGTRARRRRK